MGFRALVFILLFSTDCFAAMPGYGYQYIKEPERIIHILKVDPLLYEVQIIKAKNQKIGRETVPVIAREAGAEMAINGGFFEVGEGRDGLAVGTLVVQGIVYAMENKVMPLLIIENNKLQIKELNPQKLDWSKISLLSGIPMLVVDGEINKKILRKKGSFYIKPHARTAIGITKTGEIIIVVVEQPSKKDPLSMTISEIDSLVKSRKAGEKVSISKLKEMVMEEISLSDVSLGMTILEIAEYMREIGCVHAINLDGGGSATLWIEGSVINQIFLDKSTRPVSNAIIFKRK